MEPRSPQEGLAPWWKRVGWFVLIWGLSVGLLGLVAFFLKIIMRLAGLTT